MAKLMTEATQWYLCMYCSVAGDDGGGRRAFDQGKNYGQAKNDSVGGCSGLFSDMVSWIAVVGGSYSDNGGRKWSCIAKIGMVQMRPKRSNVGVASAKVDSGKTKQC